MHNRGRSANAAEVRRFEILAREVGCLACRKWGRDGVPADNHHPLTGGRRRGVGVTCPLCAWHHRGIPPGNLSISEAERRAGPSLALSPRAFRAEFGSDDDLLQEAQALALRFEGRIV